ncbi:MAG: tRNA glutamyl-Q(34) synthetase GluQRS [Gammaproteobacteria bacterium]|nr:tRNA glutamyl-Q(34) synthetase GluQRS [Gammaproteobacteria bacterium]
MNYRGRFAPSPTGHLHFGSLVAAVASYLDAHHHQGVWLVRIEDLDPPREVPGAADAILRVLESFALHWDESVCYQSQRHEQYHHYLDTLSARNLTYHCQCTRKQLSQYQGHYPNLCRERGLTLAHPAIRLKHLTPLASFEDRVQGTVKHDFTEQAEDFVLRRRDGLFAYQLAVVVDDIEHNISHIVRGADLIDSTFKQAQLYQYLEQPCPAYLHIPLAVTATGSKLSKQNYAPAVAAKEAPKALSQALRFLGQALPEELTNAPCPEQLAWATQHWQPQQIPQQHEIILP